MKCTICGMSVKLMPSAVERVKKFGRNPSDYSKLFTTHTSCHLKRCKKDTSRLIKEHDKRTREREVFI